MYYSWYLESLGEFLRNYVWDMNWLLEHLLALNKLVKQQN